MSESGSGNVNGEPNGIGHEPGEKCGIEEVEIADSSRDIGVAACGVAHRRAEVDVASLWWFPC